MPHQALYDQNVGALFEVVRGKTMPEIPRKFIIFRLRRKESCGFFRNEIIA
jgi:hypothetical protein